MGTFLQLTMGLSAQEAGFRARGFYEGDSEVRERLEQIGRTFIRGYNGALNANSLEALTIELEKVDLEMRGFAFEGAAMALALLDHLTPWNKRRLKRFLHGRGAGHVYMVHVGAGWAIARLPWLRRGWQRWLGTLDPLLRWLALDGYGFHEGYFHPQTYIRNRHSPHGLSGYATRVFDQGIGRSLWFVDCADLSRIQKTIALFDEPRHADLWSGVGLAAAYAGGIHQSRLEELRKASGVFSSQLAQGAAFAAAARQFASNPARHTDIACHVFCGLSAEGSARVTQNAMIDLPSDHRGTPAYEVWRQLIQTQFTREVVTV